MGFLSIIFRFIARKWQSLCSVARILRLKLLYPGLEIDFKSIVESHCTIVCVKGGKLKITGSKISFGTCVIADQGSEVTIDSCFIGRNCVITSKKAVHISKGCLIAEMVVIRDQDHLLDRRPQSGPPQNEFTCAPIFIGQDAWIASKATILKGVRVGNYSVVGASAVVTGDIPEGEVWAGIPAKFLKRTAQTQ